MIVDMARVPHFDPMDLTLSSKAVCFELAQK